MHWLSSDSEEDGGEDEAREALEEEGIMAPIFLPSFAAALQELYGSDSESDSPVARKTDVVSSSDSSDP
ncbi:unnamed protein product [Linum trigynum]|uniref:Uncharacterized protein n=1 Tax=Linum trigynum TaxID=586398 RepID=A0AAV2E952_9ROSI